MTTTCTSDATKSHSRAFAGCLDGVALPEVEGWAAIAGGVTASRCVEFADGVTAAAGGCRPIPDTTAAIMKMIVKPIATTIVLIPTARISLALIACFLSPAGRRGSIPQAAPGWKRESRMAERCFDPGAGLYVGKCPERSRRCKLNRETRFPDWRGRIETIMMCAH
jgi:hypothetical protein